MNGQNSGWPRPKRFLESGPLVLDALKSRAYMGDADLELTEEQFNALYLLVQREGAVMSFEDLYRAVWEPPDESDRREETRRCMTELVERCAAVGGGEVAIEAIPGQGYRFRCSAAKPSPL